MTRIVLTPELQTYIADRIANYYTESPEPFQWLVPYVAEFQVLPLYLGWIESIGINAEGEIVSWNTEGDYSWVKPVEERNWWLSALVVGCRRYPELLALLPSRPTGAIDCRHLAHPIFAEGNVICPKCCGLGWVDSLELK